MSEEPIKLGYSVSDGVATFGNMKIGTIPGLDAKQKVEAQQALFKTFIEVQQHVKQPSKDKFGATLKNGGGYKYADLNQVINAIQEAIKGLDIAYIQQPLTSARDSVAGVHNYLINGLGAIIDFGSYILFADSKNPQKIGGATTFARRYSISAIFGIASEEDDDARQFQSKPDFYGPDQLASMTVVYDGKHVPLVEVFAKAMAGDELAKQIIKDKDNSAPTKIGVKSINEMYELSKRLLEDQRKEEAEIKRLNEESEKKKAEEKKKVAKSENDVDPFDLVIEDVKK